MRVHETAADVGAGFTFRRRMARPPRSRMSLVVKVVASVSLAAAALWSVSSVPVTPAAPALWPGADAVAARVVDTLATEAALGQLVAAPGDAPGLAEAVRAGHVGRVEVAGGSVGDHLARRRALDDAGGLPVTMSTASGPLALPFSDAPPAPTADALAATARPDLAFMTGKAAAEAAATLGVHALGTPLGLGAHAVEAALVRGLREGGVLPTARLAGRVGLADLGRLGDAGLMEVRLSVTGDGDAETVRQLKSVPSFNGLVVADVDRQSRGAVAAVAAGADVVRSDAPGVLYDSLAAGVASGQLSRARVQESARRVLAAKAWSGLDLAPRRPAAEGARVTRISPWRPPSASFAWRAGLLRGEVARRAVTVVQGERGPLPLVGPAVPPRVFTVVLDPSPDADHALPFANALATGLPAGSASYARLSLGAPQEQYDDVRDAARDADLVVLAAFEEADGRLAARHFPVALDLLQSGRAVVFAALGPGSLAEGLPVAAATVVAYEGTAEAQQAAAQAVVGGVAVGGRLPRAVAGVAGAGAGVEYRQQALRPGAPEEAGLDAETTARIDRVMDRAVRDGAFPGGAVAVGRDGVLLSLKGYGRLSRTGASVTANTTYDLASLTKVVGTTAAAMQLVEEGALDLDAEVVTYLPRFRGLGKEFVTVRQLLAHSAGQRPWFPFHANGIADERGALDFIYADTLRYPPGTRSRYSDFDMIVLGKVIEEVEDDRLDDVLQRRIFGPLGMDATGFRGVGVVDRDVAPTEADNVWRRRTLQGEVHDEAASVLGGVAGHAGLFSTASDLARFAYVLSNGGAGYGTRLFRRTTLDAFVEPVRLRATYPTGLGWMVNAGRGNTSAGSMGPRSFGHTGFTGTSIWVDPESRLFVVLLTNRVHPSRRNRRITDVRTALADAVAGSVETPPGEASRMWGFGPVPDDLPDVAAR